MDELPISAGLQMIFCDDAAQGRKRHWTRNRRAVDVDALAQMEAAITDAQVQI
jgi:hypothetical protein